MRHTLFAAAIALSAPTLTAPALAQSGPLSGLTDPAALSDAASKAAETLAKQAKHRLLASNMLGRTVTGPDGSTVGTVDDLVVIPGGKIVAVLVKPKKGDPLALPYQALKVSAAASAGRSLGLTLPIGLDQARGMQALQDLTSAVTSPGG